MDDEQQVITRNSKQTKKIILVAVFCFLVIIAVFVMVIKILIDKSNDKYTFTTEETQTLYNDVNKYKEISIEVDGLTISYLYPEYYVDTVQEQDDTVELYYLNMNPNGNEGTYICTTRKKESISEIKNLKGYNLNISTTNGNTVVTSNRVIEIDGYKTYSMYNEESNKDGSVLYHMNYFIYISDNLALRVQVLSKDVEEFKTMLGSLEIQ